jgi:hypothetical protein
MKNNLILITLFSVTIFEKVINYLFYNFYSEEMYWEQYSPTYWEKTTLIE